MKIYDPILGLQTKIMLKIHFVLVKNREIWRNG